MNGVQNTQVFTHPLAFTGSQRRRQSSGVLCGQPGDTAVETAAPIAAKCPTSRKAGKRSIAPAAAVPAIYPQPTDPESHILGVPGALQCRHINANQSPNV